MKTPNPAQRAGFFLFWYTTHMTQFLYHRVPKNFTEDILYPLNQLIEMYPDIYAGQAAKYDNRKSLMERTIPILHCLWNDVLHLGPINPTELIAALTEAGMMKKELSFFQIDPAILEPELTVIYKYTNMEKINQVNEKEFQIFNPDLLPTHSHIPPATKQYYKEEYQAGRKPLLFHGIPHVLYKGTINTSNLPIITL